MILNLYNVTVSTKLGNDFIPWGFNVIAMDEADAERIAVENGLKNLWFTKSRIANVASYISEENVLCDIDELMRLGTAEAAIADSRTYIEQPNNPF
jgi:hypothetical protein